MCVCERERERDFTQYPNMIMRGSFPPLTNCMVLKDVNVRISLCENKLEKKKLLRIKPIKEIPECSLLLTKKFKQRNWPCMFTSTKKICINKMAF